MRLLVLILSVVAALAFAGVCEDDWYGPPIPEYAKPSADEGFVVVYEGSYSNGFNDVRIGLYASDKPLRSVYESLRQRLRDNGWSLTPSAFDPIDPFAMTVVRDGVTLDYSDFDSEQSYHADLILHQVDAVAAAVNEYGTIVRIMVLKDYGFQFLESVASPVGPPEDGINWESLTEGQPEVVSSFERPDCGPATIVTDFVEANGLPNALIEVGTVEKLTYKPTHYRDRDPDEYMVELYRSEELSLWRPNEERQQEDDYWRFLIVLTQPNGDSVSYTKCRIDLRDANE